MDEQARSDDVQETALEDLEVAEAQGDEVTGGKAEISDIMITHKVDKSSPVLLQ